MLDSVRCHLATSWGSGKKISSQSVTKLLVALEQYSCTVEVNSNRVLLRPAWAVISRITSRCVPFSIRPSYFSKTVLAKGQRLEKELVITRPVCPAVPYDLFDRPSATSVLTDGMSARTDVEDGSDAGVGF